MSSATPQYLAFVLFPDRVSIVVWKKTGGNIQVLSQSSIIDAPTGLDDDLSRAIDTALDELGPEGLKVKEALFVVAPDWVEAGDLSAKKKRFLKVLTHDLMLEPLGYVVLSDTLLAHESAQSPQPFAGILVYDSSREWLIEQITDGQVIDTQRVGKSQDLTADTTELHSRLQALGSVKRAILVPLNPASQEASETTIESAVGTSLETLAPAEIIRIAVTIGGAEILQGKPEQAAETIETPEELPQLITTDDFQNVDLSALDTLQTELDEDLSNEELVEIPVVPASPTVWDIEPQEGGRVSEVSPAGFVIHRSAQDAVPDENIEYVEEFTEQPIRAKRSFAMPKFSLPSFGSFPALKLGGKKKSAAIIGGVGVLLLVLGGAGAYWQLSQSYTANITVWLQPQTIEQDFTFTAGAASVSSSGALPLPGEIITESVTLDTEVPATGSKITGDPASGNITLFNKTTQSKTFAAGTKLQGDGKAFQLIDEVTVASASTNIETTTHGKAEARVRAVEIGPEGNIAKDLKFTVANFDSSSYEAQAKDPFSGGTKREIQAVSQKDIDQAAQQLRIAAQEQLKESFSTLQQEGNTIFPSEQVAVTGVSSSPKLNEEAKFVTVSITAKSDALKLTADQSSQEGQELLAAQVAENQELLTDTVEFQAKNVTVSPDGKTFLLTATVTGQAVHRLLAEDIKTEIVGLYAARAATVLSEKAGVANAEVVVEPSWIRWMFPNLPSNRERIKLNIKLDRNS